MYLNTKKLNNSISESKMGVEILFPEPYGSMVEFECKFDTLGFSPETQQNDNVCVNFIIKDGKNCIDINEKGEDVCHFWLNKVANSNFNPLQYQLWRNFKKGNSLKIKGKLSYYDDYKTKNRKMAILEPTILEIDHQLVR